MLEGSLRGARRHRVHRHDLPARRWAQADDACSTNSAEEALAQLSSRGSGGNRHERVRRER